MFDLFAYVARHSGYKDTVIFIMWYVLILCGMNFMALRHLDYRQLIIDSWLLWAT